MNLSSVKFRATTLTLAAALFVLAPAGLAQDRDWKGFYVGANFGYGWGAANTSFTPLPTAVSFVNLLPQTLHPDPAGAFGGGQVGANWQRGHFVLGAEFDISGAAIDGTLTVTPITQNDGTPYPGAGFLSTHQDLTWLATLRARMGFTLVPRFLLYGTGGMAFANVHSSAMSDFRPYGTESYPAASSKTMTGWTAGAGAEVSLSRRWSFKGEYLRYDLGTETITVGGVPANAFQVQYVWQTTGNLAKFGVNFRF